MENKLQNWSICWEYENTNGQGEEEAEEIIAAIVNQLKDEMAKEE